MKTMKNALALLLVVLMLATAAAGCGGAANEPESTAATTAATTAAQTDKAATEPAAELEGTIVINPLANTPGLKEGWEAVAKGYMDIHPKVKITVDPKPQESYGEWVKNELNSEKPVADIISGNMAGSAKDGKVINWLEYINNKSPYSDGVWKDQFNYDLQQKNVAKQLLDTISLESVQVLWFYNKDMFSKADVKAPTTWKELVDVCGKLQKAGIQPLAVPGDYQSFWAMQLGWLAQIYADQTSRSWINTTRAQDGDFCYDPDMDGVWKYNVNDPYNDDTWVVNQNELRFYNAMKDGTIKADSEGMRTVMSSLKEVFPKYAGGDAFFGTKDPAHIQLFLQGKAAMLLNGGWFFTEFKRAMDSVASGKEITAGSGDAAVKVDGVQKFEMGSFNNPSMEGPGIEAPVRTIEVAVGFLSGVKKDKAHDDLVADFMMYYSSKEGYGKWMTAALNTGYNPAGPSLVYNVELPEEYAKLFAEVKFIGNGQKGYGNRLARGTASNKGDIDPSYREWYKYTQDFLTGKIDVTQWAKLHQANHLKYLPEAMKNGGISENDLKNPQNAPTGK